MLDELEVDPYLTDDIDRIIEQEELPLPVLARLIQIRRACPNVRAAEWVRTRAGLTFIWAVHLLVIDTDGATRLSVPGVLGTPAGESGPMPYIIFPPVELLSEQLAHIIKTEPLPLPLIARLAQIQRDCPSVRRASHIWLEEAQPWRKIQMICGWKPQIIYLHLYHDGQARVSAATRFSTPVLYYTPPECWEKLREHLDR